MNARSLSNVQMAFLASCQSLDPTFELVPRTYQINDFETVEHRFAMRTNDNYDAAILFFAAQTYFIRHDLTMYMNTVFEKREVFGQKTGHRWARSSQHIQLPAMLVSSQRQVSQ